MALTGESLRSWVRGTSVAGVAIAAGIAAVSLPVLGAAGLFAAAGVAALGVAGLVHSVVAKPDDMARTAKSIQSDFDSVKNFFSGRTPESPTPARPEREGPPVAERPIPYSGYVQQGFNPDAIQMPVGQGQVMPQAEAPAAGARVQFAAASPRATMPSP